MEPTTRKPIESLFETHLTVRSMEAAIAFYCNKLGLQLASVDEARRIAFCWIGDIPNTYMLGLWEKPAAEIAPRHFAFRCSIDFIRTEASDWLMQRGLRPYNFLKDESTQPMVFAWMPALAIYFDDPDGNVLEFIAPLPGKSWPEGGIMTYLDWIKSEASVL